MLQEACIFIPLCSSDLESEGKKSPVQIWFDLRI